MKSLTAQLLLSTVVVLLNVGCTQDRTETLSQENRTVTTSDTKTEATSDTKTDNEELQRYFQYALPDWCNRLFGAKHDTAGLCELAKFLDVDLDLVAYDQWSDVKKAEIGLSCVLPVMGAAPDGEDYLPFVPGFNDEKLTDQVRGALDEALDKASEGGVPFVLVFTGFDTGDTRDVQYERIVKGFTDDSSGESLVAKAERLGVTFVIEMLNTEGDEETWRGHPGYLGNNTTELVEKVVRPIDSKNFRLAFDVYHVVMMGEDPLEMIEQHHDVIGYVHVAGVMTSDEGHHPENRGELNLDGQVIDYPPIMAALAQHLPSGTYVLLEYIPNRITALGVRERLQQAIALCEQDIQQ